MSIKDEAVAWVKDYFEKNGNADTKALIGISGGKGSSTVAALCCAALGKDRVIGVMMPNGVQKDIDDSKRLCEFLGIRNYTINIAEAYKGLSEEIASKMNTGKLSDQFTSNAPARLRMAALYGVAATEGNCRISCNGNLSERLTGFFTLWGDGAGDFAPLAYLFVSEVVQLGLELGLPQDLCRKAPSDGMCGKTDEDKYGFTYDELEKVARGNEKLVDGAKVRLIKSKLESMAFKRRLLNLPCFVPSDKNPKDW